MPEQFASPKWDGTSLDSPITQFALPLFAVRGREVYPSGTACIIASWLAITARHVVTDHFEHFAGRPPGPGDESKHHTLTYVQPAGGEPAIPLFVRRIWFVNECDIAVLHLVPGAKMDVNRRWACPRLSLLPPRKGSQIAAFGYPKSRVEYDDPKGRTVHMDARTATGTVLEVHHSQRDRGIYSFPCFQTNARIDPGMSGGPVLDDNGHVCGLICGSLPPFAPNEDHVSYISTLWPLLGIMIDQPWDRYPEGTMYPIFNYAAAKIIDTIGLEHFAFERTATGNQLVSRYDQASYDQDDVPGFGR